MRIPIPDDILKLISRHKAHGDYSTMSKRLTKSEDEPEGNTSRQEDIRSAIKKGYGDVEVVREIAQFYLDKQKAVQQINSLS